jgi:ABC-type transport system involved in multi-copper enzyme maturation permease subunit
MRPYLAIIKDSFREAMASRVLWILLALITLALLVIAPLTYQQKRTVGLRDIEHWPEIAEKLREASSGSASAPITRIWSLLDKNGQQQVRDFKPIKQRPKLRDMKQYQDSQKGLQQTFDKLLKSREFYDRADWSGSRLSFEGQQLAARQKELDDEEMQRLNRIAFEAAFPGIIHSSPSTSFQLQYALYGDLGEPLPVSKQQMVNFFRQNLPWFIDKILLSIGLLVAVLVTAPIIPQTFDPGSLHLLLSKPINRSLLYVTKFLGGCAFVLLAATYLFIGLWLLLGWRLGVWETRLLWCIPIYGFVFAIYYSVAALAGLFWRNTIVSIIVAMLFWGLCFGVGIADGLMKGIVEKGRIKQIVPAGEQTVVVDRSNTPLAWNANLKRWDVVFLGEEAAEMRSVITAVAQLPRMTGPVYDPRGKQLVALATSFRNGQQMIVAGDADQSWRNVEIAAAPSSPLVLLSAPDGAPILVTSDGFSRLASDLKAADKPIKFMGFDIPLRTRGPLEDIGPAPRQTWGSPANATLDPTSGRIAVVSRGELMTYEPDSSGKYRKLSEQKLKIKDDQKVKLAFAGNTIVIAYGTGELLLVDATSLATRNTVQTKDSHAVEAIATDPAGRQFAVLLDDDRLWLLDPQSGAMQLAKVRGQGDISAMAYDPGGNLLVADRTTRVTQYAAASWQEERQLAPSFSLTEWTYRYIVRPIYWVCPKPGEFYKTVQYVLLAQDDNKTEAHFSAGSLQSELHPWAPVRSSFAFMLVMLAIGCVYMQWQEF